MSEQVLHPGSEVIITHICYDAEEGVLEVYGDRATWWPIPMTQEEADKIGEELETTGCFLYKEVRHVLEKEESDLDPLCNLSSNQD